MGGGRELGVVELGEQLGDHSVHYSGFGLLGDMLRDQGTLQKEEEKDEEVLDDRLQKRSHQQTVIEAGLPGYKPQKGVNWEDGGFLPDSQAEEEERLQGYERTSPLYMEISQQSKVNVEDGGVEMVEVQVEPFTGNVDMLPLEVEVCLDIVSHKPSTNKSVPRPNIHPSQFAIHPISLIIFA